MPDKLPPPSSGTHKVMPTIPVLFPSLRPSCIPSEADSTERRERTRSSGYVLTTLQIPAREPANKRRGVSTVPSAEVKTPLKSS